MGIKDFFRKIGKGFKKAGRWIKDKALPAIGRVAKPILNVIGLLSGKIGMIGKIGSAVTGVLHDVTNKIPNEEARKKIGEFIDKGSEKFRGVIDRGKEIADGANRVVGVGKEMIDTAKKGWNTQIKPAVPPKVLNKL